VVDVLTVENICQRPLWEGDQEVEKRSSRDEPMLFAIHKCTEAMLGIPLYNLTIFIPN
jgi:hypothetical protein